MRASPSTVLAGAALFFALGGSAIAVTEAVRPQARCQPGAVRGFVAVNGDPAKGIANIGDAFTSARPVVGARFNCAGAAPQARRVNVGVYEVRFPGNSAQVAMASAGAAETTIAALGGGVFRVSLWVPGRQDAVDTPFAVTVV
ncbi:MAG TPA: hypothetical protein VJM07_13200 [Gaiella sp.]|jgi:hypothetical protein|nr:hypothetical protein [Gaiella sp.]